MERSREELEAILPEGLYEVVIGGRVYLAGKGAYIDWLLGVVPPMCGGVCSDKSTKH